MKKILVTGGTGYIGSHTIVDLLDNGYEVISIDNLVNSDGSMLKGIKKITGKTVKNYKVDLTNLKATRKVFERHPDIEGIIHFAALKSVGESVGEPLLYFKNNLEGLMNILICAKDYNVKNFIFSSSCTVYGNADELPVTEETPQKEAESPYGRTKQIGENIIKDFAKAYPDFKSILLRYFNPAGAHESALIGEMSIKKAIYLVPVIMETAAGRRKETVVFGDTYDTRDGSCIRDYIHVMDVASAHTKSLEYLMQGKNESNCEVFNIGIGEGVSVLEAIHAFERVTAKKLNYRIGPPRDGDVVAIYSNYDKARDKLGWEPKRNIDDIMKTAWAWEQVLLKRRELT